MADFNALEALINAHIKKNGVQAITGNILNGILRGMVSALGKGYTIAGSASPATDPGTMTGPLAYIAYTAGTYTNFGGLEVEQGEVAMLIYNEAEWHKEVLFSLAAQATIDDNIGVPEVGVSFVNGILSFDFRNMKGEPGENGDPAGFGNVSATVDGNVGTPGVSVQTSGPDTAKNITFQFTNLKGETGVTSVVATVDNTVGTPTCTVSLVGQQLTLAFSGLKGAQGDTGSSVDYPFTIVNNLTTNDATQALSAAMGVELAGQVSQLEHKVDKVAIPLLYDNGYITLSEAIGTVINLTKTSNQSFKCYYGECEAGDTIVINGTGGYASRLYGFIDIDNKLLEVAPGGTSYTNEKKIAPTGSKHIIINDSSSRTSYYIQKGTVYDRVNVLEGKMSENEEKISGLETNVAGLEEEQTHQDIILHDLREEVFDTQQVCLHHDNFHRTITGDLWKIGSNDPTGNTMNYTSPLSNYDTVDDGFRIIDNVLVNDTSVSVATAFRIIDAYASVYGEFFLTVAIPEQGKYAEIFHSFVSENEYSLFRIYNNAGQIEVTRGTSRNGTDTMLSAKLVNDNFACSSITFQFRKRNMRIYLDGTDMYYRVGGSVRDVFDNYPLDDTLPFGIRISTQRNYQYRFVNLFNVRKKQGLDNSLVMKYGRKPSGIFTLSPATMPGDYSYNIIGIQYCNGFFNGMPELENFPYHNKIVNTEDLHIYEKSGVGGVDHWQDNGTPVTGCIVVSISDKKQYIYNGEEYVLQGEYGQDRFPYCERFELRKADAVSSATARIENVQSRFARVNLRKHKISFDILVPVGYVPDGSESVMQIQTINDLSGTRPPMIVISTSNRINGVRFEISVRSIATKYAEGETLTRNDSIDVGEVVFGKWTHFELFFKQGYMDGHNPLTLLMRDGKEVFRSYVTNCYNNVDGAVVRYGIYKSEYYANKPACVSDERIVYIANFIAEE